MRPNLTAMAVLVVAGATCGCHRPPATDFAKVAFVQPQPDPVEPQAAKCLAEAPMHRSDECVAMEIALLEKAKQKAPER